MRTTLHTRDLTPALEALDPAALRELAVFPLPNAVLLPGGMLPLHVFEPRYREMTKDCLAGSRTMAIALLERGYEDDYYGRPPVHPICGVGTILASEELPDGRYHLLLRGVTRVRIEEELPGAKTYRVARATLLDGRGTSRPQDLPIAHAQLLAVCDRLALALEHGGSELCELVRAQTDPGSCADAVAAVLVTDPRLRQCFLDTVDATDRVDAAVDLVGRILCALAPTSGAAN
jgi:Lon protease-like protein